MKIEDILKITPEGRTTLMFYQRCINWKKDFIWHTDIDGSSWWESKSGHKSGKKFDSMEDCELSALISWCNSNPTPRRNE